MFPLLSHTKHQHNNLTTLLLQSLNSNSNKIEAVLDLPQKKKPKNFFARPRLFITTKETRNFLINELRLRTENPKISLQNKNPIQQIQDNPD
jgi:hypothetical protein